MPYYHGYAKPPTDDSQPPRRRRPQGEEERPKGRAEKPKGTDPQDGRPQTGVLPGKDGRVSHCALPPEPPISTPQ